MIASFTKESVPTPAMVLDGKTVRHNIAQMSEYVASHNLNIRPHTKTHKSRHIARLQLENGAQGLTVAKAGEAQVMIDVCDNLLVAYPALDPWRAKQLAELARRSTVCVAVDSIAAVDALALAAQGTSSTLGILVDVDVGMKRTGLQSDEATLNLARRIDKTQGVRLDGIMCYPGHIWEASAHQDLPLAKVSDQLRNVLQLWKRNGFSATIVSGGSTPTAYQSHLVPELTEIRAGTYVFNDLNTFKGGFCRLEDCAARVICTVVSTAVPRQVVLDSGSKTLTSDRCLPAPDSGHGLVVEYPHAKIVGLSEEHAQVDVSDCERAPQLGERVTVVPNHICPCINLQEHVWWFEQGEPLQLITIDARGKIV